MNKNIIWMITLLLIRLATSGDGKLLTYLVCILIPYLIMITLLMKDAHKWGVEYYEWQKTEESRLADVLDKIYGRCITKSFLRRFTPYVERIIIKMIIAGDHSIHAAPAI